MATICKGLVAPHARRGILAGCVALLIFFAAPLANAQMEIFLKLDGIKGESVDKEHAGEIVALDLQWGMSQSSSMHMATGGGAGKVSVQESPEWRPSMPAARGER